MCLWLTFLKCIMSRIKIILLWRQYNKIFPSQNVFLPSLRKVCSRYACWLCPNDVMCGGISWDYIPCRRKRSQRLLHSRWEKTLNLQMLPSLLIQNWWNVKVVLKHKTLLDNVFDCIGSVLLSSHSSLAVFLSHSLVCMAGEDGKSFPYAVIGKEKKCF